MFVATSYTTHGDDANFNLALSKLCIVHCSFGVKSGFEV